MKMGVVDFRTPPHRVELGTFFGNQGPIGNHFVKKSACLNVVLGWVSIMPKIQGLCGVRASTRSRHSLPNDVPNAPSKAFFTKIVRLDSEMYIVLYEYPGQ